MNKISYIDKIDNYFSLKTKNETSLTFMGVFLIVAFIFYILLFDPSIYEIEDAQKSYNTTYKNLTDTNQYLQSVSQNNDDNFLVNQKITALNNSKQNLQSIKNANKYFDDKLIQLSYLLFNEQNWAIFLNTITNLANENNIKIQKIKNEFKILTPQKIQQALNISIDLEGKFDNILEFINSIEESKLIVDIHKMDIVTTQNSLIGKIDISVWGVKY
ncbi:type 4a pilus biogenesis protein PilO [Campylobacter sputorum]|uniref:type 4a pilus biogenesis protein PilO n=1 Tax=Campylobacter sputorum TaxID=206 RepID=UPI000689CDB6|nr:type 4a pilus biogenesis protein PilO [Campylobacter sputorum]